MKFYAVTSYKPSAVTDALRCELVPHASNLVLSKGNHLEIYGFSKEEGMDVEDGDQDDENKCSLSLVEDVPLNGRIVSVQRFRPKDAEQDRLFILTEHKHFCVLG